MKKRLYSGIILLISMFALSACGPNVEKAAIPSVEKVFKAKGMNVKCSEIVNIRQVHENDPIYTGRALIKHEGQRACYTVRIEMVGEYAIVEVDGDSRVNLN